MAVHKLSAKASSRFRLGPDHSCISFYSDGCIVAGSLLGPLMVVRLASYETAAEDGENAGIGKYSL